MPSGATERLRVCLHREDQAVPFTTGSRSHMALQFLFGEDAEATTVAPSPSSEALDAQSVAAGASSVLIIQTPASGKGGRRRKNRRRKRRGGGGAAAGAAAAGGAAAKSAPEPEVSAADAEAEEGAEDDVFDRAYRCALGDHLMTDPVSYSGSDYVFDRATIEDWVEQHSTCPITGAAMSVDDLYDLPDLRAEISRYGSLAFCLRRFLSSIAFALN